MDPMLKALDTLIKIQAGAAAAEIEGCEPATCLEPLHWCTGCDCHLVAAYTCSNCD